MSIIPPPYRLLAYALIAVALIGLGVMYGSKWTGEEAEVREGIMQKGFDDAFARSSAALIVANNAAAAKTASGAAGVSGAQSQLAMGNANVATSSRVSDALAGRVRMRVDAICPAPARSGKLPGADAAPAGNNGPAGPELSAAATGRFEAGLDEVKRLQNELAAAQTTIASYFTTCGPPSATPAAPAAPVTAPAATPAPAAPKRHSYFGIGSSAIKPPIKQPEDTK